MCFFIYRFIHGNDIFGLSTSDEAVAVGSDHAVDLVGVFDSFGQFGQAGSDFYADSIAIRKPESPLSLTGPLAFEGGGFEIVPYSDGVLFSGSGFGSYAVIPEPAAVVAMAAFLTMGGGVLRFRRICRWRRRRRAE